MRNGFLAALSLIATMTNAVASSDRPAVRLEDQTVVIDYERLNKVDRAALHFCFGQELNITIEDERFEASGNEFQRDRQLNDLVDKVVTRSKDCNPRVPHNLYFEQIPVAFLSSDGRYYSRRSNSYSFCFPTTLARGINRFDWSGNFVNIVWTEEKQPSRVVTVDLRCRDTAIQGPSNQLEDPTFKHRFNYIHSKPNAFFLPSTEWAEPLFNFAVGKQNYMDVYCRIRHVQQMGRGKAPKGSLTCLPERVTLYRERNDQANAWGKMNRTNDGSLRSATMNVVMGR